MKKQILEKMKKEQANYKKLRLMLEALGQTAQKENLPLPLDEDEIANFIGSLNAVIYMIGACEDSIEADIADIDDIEVEA